MKKIDFSKTIGLVRLIAGGYIPSNDRQQVKLDKMFREGSGGLFADAPTRIEEGQLTELRQLAKEAGYKIVTSIRSL